jgi:hypothetical protein
MHSSIAIRRGRRLAALLVLGGIVAPQGMPALHARDGSMSMRAAGPLDDETEHEEEDGAARPATYRTLCVRLCDGYYFPISFAASRAHLGDDARACESRCGTEARLFVYRNPGGDIGDMRDPDGLPYRKLATAYLYRTQYVPSCKCQPHPWEAEALRRHRRYALTAAAGAGDQDAARKLQLVDVATPVAGKVGIGDAKAAHIASDRPQRDRIASRSRPTRSARSDDDWDD